MCMHVYWETHRPIRSMLAQNGVHYWYTTKEEFEKGIKEGRFLEYAHVHNNIYGTSFQVNAVLLS